MREEGGNEREKERMKEKNCVFNISNLGKIFYLK